jgi:hypothetical protein
MIKYKERYIKINIKDDEHRAKLKKLLQDNGEGHATLVEVSNHISLFCTLDSLDIRLF